ncbi:MAG: HDOD domain-containing protein [Planctomycetaceae bacterium]
MTTSSETSTSALETLNWTQLRSAALDELASLEFPDDIEIPALPQAVTQFADRASDPNVEVPELAAIVETCPGLTFEILKYVNSANFGLKNPIRSVAQAISHIGLNAAKTYLIAAGVKAATAAMESRLLNHRNFWNESLQRGLFARATAAHLKLDSGLAFMGGLLQDFMLPAMTNQFDSDYIMFMEYEAKSGRDMVDWEQETFGWNHAAAAALVAQKWHFPDDLVCALFYHHSLKTTLGRPEMEFFKLFPVTMSALLPDQLMQCPTGIAELIRVDSRCSAIDLDELCRIVDQQQMEQADGFEIPNHLYSMVQDERAIVAGSSS